VSFFFFSLSCFFSSEEWWSRVEELIKQPGILISTHFHKENFWLCFSFFSSSSCRSGRVTPINIIQLYSISYSSTYLLVFITLLCRRPRVWVSPRVYCRLSRNWVDGEMCGGTALAGGAPNYGAPGVVATAVDLKVND
jgi:hypothetical protein